MENSQKMVIFKIVAMATVCNILILMKKKSQVWLIFTVNARSLNPKVKTNSSFLVHPSSGVHTVKTVGSHLNVAYWEHSGASCFIRDTNVNGYTIPFIHTPPSAHFTNNRSAIVYSDFVAQAISDLLATGSVVECDSAPIVVKIFRLTTSFWVFPGSRMGLLSFTNLLFYLSAFPLALIYLPKSLGP